MSSSANYACTHCGQRIRKWDLSCPACGQSVTRIRCRQCGREAGRNEFLNDRCPVCRFHHAAEVQDQLRPSAANEHAGRYSCSGCGGAVSSQDYWCPHCKGCLVGIRCMRCGYHGMRVEFQDGECPRCHASSHSSASYDADLATRREWRVCVIMAIGAATLIALVILIFHLFS